jgi:hypothetical protein
LRPFAASAAPDNDGDARDTAEHRTLARRILSYMEGSRCEDRRHFAPFEHVRQSLAELVHEAEGDSISRQPLPGLPDFYWSENEKIYQIYTKYIPKYTRFARFFMVRKSQKMKKYTK